MTTSKVQTITLASAVLLLAVSLILFPQDSFQASTRGLHMWWEIVFPSLLPFFIVSEMMISLGVVRFIGILLEPLMRPLFKVPGVGGFVWAMGMASGFPSGAKLTARLRKEGTLTRIEAERLVSFTNCSNPLFIFGAVSVGFFFNPTLGILLAIAHYAGNIFVGMFMRFHGRDEIDHPIDKSKFSIKEALRVMHKTRMNNNKPIGKLLGEAVSSSIQSLLMIGGFIILFSVLNKLLFLLHVTPFFAENLKPIFTLLGLDPAMTMAYISGIFEITLGSQLTSQVETATLLQQAIVTSFILAFSGFSVQAQVASILAETDIRFKPFFMARIMHGVFASIITLVLWKVVFSKFQYNDVPSTAIPVFQQNVQEIASSVYQWFVTFGPIITIFSLSLYTILLWRRIKSV
ncbi:sporulation integral membrane protein YlbJ [Mangrovibacillus cuniculi]|uniref:Sporulation integral membrane protein YlbJ n=1 Tax=Mangrovibacillus cuniculi TaxID=2593652 RepID=A0A7S8CEI4_9BACI|nr:sporulation integral membrane protein YlbJ [Mangrovibacillus cuniculi]QPC48358.1 sporulation integral membrane protein YlbJ [Mangrovibacillus cuniculi]